MRVAGLRLKVEVNPCSYNSTETERCSSLEDIFPAGAKIADKKETIELSSINPVGSL